MQAGSALSKVSDKAGEKTPDVNVPGFGPFKFNPKEDAKQAAKKSPLGFLKAPALTNQVHAPSMLPFVTTILVLLKCYNHQLGGRNPFVQLGCPSSAVICVNMLKNCVG